MGRPKKTETVVQPANNDNTPDYLKGIQTEQPQQSMQAPAPIPQPTGIHDVPALAGFNPENVRPKMVTKIMPNVANPNDRKGLMSGSGVSVNVYNKKTGRTVVMNEKAFNRIKRNNPHLSKTHG